MQHKEVGGIIGYPEFRARRETADKRRKEEDAKRVRLILGTRGVFSKVGFEVFSFLNEEDGGFFKTAKEKPKAKIVDFQNLKQKPVA